MFIKEKTKSKIIFKQKDIRLDIFLKQILFKDNGYYINKKPIGKKGDFITAPEISQMFGEIIGIYFYYIWKKKINSKFNFIELGPGNGTLYNDIMKSLMKFRDFISNADVTFIEINKELIKLQKKKIKNQFLINANWQSAINYKSKYPSIIYSNEFFDCFPVRQFLFKDVWFEKYVSYDNYEKKFFFKNKQVKNQKLLSNLKKYKKEKIAEISHQRSEYFEKICKFIKKNGGIFFTIDYGYFEKNTNFTLQAIHNHNYSHVLENLGKADITSHVDFEELIKIAKSNKLEIDEATSQRDFLIKYGILERAKVLSKLDDPQLINNDLERLINKKQMGNLFKCLIVSNI
ncbi:SAM-dependent methyltransferase [Pelagibacteraceae bacterium]|nr:SAM-dependent methyltransferase [Pelagibacteraceae bacterium]